MGIFIHIGVSSCQNKCLQDKGIHKDCLVHRQKYLEKLDIFLHIFVLKHLHNCLQDISEHINLICPQQRLLVYHLGIDICSRCLCNHNNLLYILEYID